MRTTLARSNSVLFGTGENYGNIRSEPGRRALAADKYYHQAFSVFRRDDRGGQEPPLLRQIARIIDDLIDIRVKANRAITGPPGARGGLAIVGPPSRQEEYIDRVELTHQVMDAFERGERLIYLAGDAGTGKTTLGRSIAKTIAGRTARKVIEIAGTTRQSAADSMAHHVLRASLTLTSDSAVIYVAFRQFLDERSPGLLLLIDDLDQFDASIVDDFNDLFVVVTSRKLPQNPAQSFVTVGNLTKPQARQLIQARVPGASSKDASTLATVLDGRPLAIIQCCAFLSEEGMSVPDFCRALRESAAMVLDGITHPEERTLTAIYQMILQRIEPHPLAVKLLGFVGHCPNIIGSTFAEKALAYDEGRFLGSPALNRVNLYRALSILRHFCLVRVEDSGVIAMYNLTATLILHSHAMTEAYVNKAILHIFALMEARLMRTPAWDSRIVHLLKSTSTSDLVGAGLLHPSLRLLEEMTGSYDSAHEIGSEIQSLQVRLQAYRVDPPLYAKRYFGSSPHTDTASAPKGNTYRPQLIREANRYRGRHRRQWFQSRRKPPSSST